MAMSCANADAQTAARGLFKTFLTHRTMPEIVSSDRGTHFTGEVYKKFCIAMGIKQELHVPWRPQSSGNVERAHRTLKNALFILTNQRNEAWPDLLESCVSSMNASKNKATGVAPHFVVYGRHPSIGLPVPDTDTRHSDPVSYGMILSHVLRDTAAAVTTASEEADRALEKRENSKPSPVLNVGDKCLLYRPQSAMAKRLHADWIGPFIVTKTNHMIAEVADDEGLTQWVHRFHLRNVPERPIHLQDPSIIQAVPVPIPANTLENEMPNDLNSRQNPTHVDENTIHVDENSIHVEEQPNNNLISDQSTSHRRRSKIPVSRRRYPTRVRNPPRKHKDYQKY